jgi:hypothetical protein
MSRSFDGKVAASSKFMGGRFGKSAMMIYLPQGPTALSSELITTLTIALKVSLQFHRSGFDVTRDQEGGGVFVLLPLPGRGEAL